MTDFTTDDLRRIAPSAPPPTGKRYRTASREVLTIRKIAGQIPAPQPLPPVPEPREPAAAEEGTNV